MEWITHWLIKINDMKWQTFLITTPFLEITAKYRFSIPSLNIFPYIGITDSVSHWVLVVANLVVYFVLSLWAKWQRQAASAAANEFVCACERHITELNWPHFRWNGYCMRLHSALVLLFHFPWSIYSFVKMQSRKIYIHLILKSLEMLKQRVLNITKRRYYHRSNHQHTLLPSSSVTAISNSQPLTSQWTRQVNRRRRRRRGKKQHCSNLSERKRWWRGGQYIAHIWTWVRCHPFKILLLLWNITKYACNQTHQTHHVNVSVRTNMIGIVFRVIEMSCYLWMNGWLSVYEQKE